MEKRIIKADGQEQEFSELKLIDSILKAGASEELARKVANQIAADAGLTSTEEVNSKVIQLLLPEHRPLAGRYNLKRAIMRLGPSGFPFEKFVARLFEAMGYEVKINQILQGSCVTHEVDVVIKKDNINYGVEVKFHNKTGYKSNVKVPLYIKARFDDILKGENQLKISDFYLVVNTKFTDDAWIFANCSGIKAISWEQPTGNNLARLIDQNHVHPVTAVTSLPENLFGEVLKKGVVLCSELAEAHELLAQLGLNAAEIGTITREASAIAALKNEM